MYDMNNIDGLYINQCELYLDQKLIKKNIDMNCFTVLKLIGKVKYSRLTCKSYINKKKDNN